MGSSMRIVRRRYEEPPGLFSMIIPLAQTICGVQTIVPSITSPCSLDSRQRDSLMTRIVRKFDPLIKPPPLLINYS